VVNMAKMVGTTDMEKTVLLEEVRIFLDAQVKAQPGAQEGLYKLPVALGDKTGTVYFDHRNVADRPKGRVYGFWTGDVRIEAAELRAIPEVRQYREFVAGLLSTLGYPKNQQRFEKQERPAEDAKSAQTSATGRDMSNGAPQQQAPPTTTMQPDAKKGDGSSSGKAQVQPQVQPPVPDVAHQEHYTRLGIQPIEVMLLCLPREQMIGFMKGNIIKYRMRCKDEAKALQYEAWLAEYEQTGKIAQFARGRKR
jgi:hypothetical protein